MTGSLSWQWLPSADESETAGAVYSQVTRDLFLQAFDKTDQNQLGFLIAGIEKGAEQDQSPTTLLAYFAVLLSIALRGIDPKHTKQGNQALKSLSESELGTRSLLSAPFLVALINELALRARNSVEDDASVLPSLQIICQTLGQNSTVLRQILRESVTQPIHGKIDNLIANTAGHERGWTQSLTEAAGVLERHVTLTSCGVVAKIIREGLSVAAQAGSSSSSHKHRTLFDRDHPAKRQKKESEIAQSMEEVVAAAINMFGATTMRWSEKVRWFHTLLAYVGLDQHETFVQQTIAALTNRCSEAGHERWQTVLFGVLPQLLLDLAKQDGKGALLVTGSKAAGTPSSSAMSDGPSSRRTILAETLKVLRADEDVEMSDDATQHRDEGTALVYDISSKARQGGTTESAHLHLEHLNDSSTAKQLVQTLKEFPSASPMLKWLPAALQEAVKALNTGDSDTLSLEPVAVVCTGLLDAPQLLHDIFLFATPQDLLRPFEEVFMNPQVFENLDWPSAGGDEGPAQLKQILLFVQAVQIAQREDVYPRLAPPREDADISRLSDDERALTSRWISELFDSDGIGDEIIRDSPPSLLLKLAPIMFSQSLTAAEIGVIDLDLLKSGLSFFLQDLLSYTLPRVVCWLLQEIRRVTTLKVDRRDQRRPVSLESDQQQKQFTRTSGLIVILHMILTDESCPSLALQVAKGPFDTLLQQSVISVVLGASLQYKVEDYDVALVMAVSERLASVVRDAAQRRPFFPPTLNEVSYQDCIAELEPFAGLMTWSDTTRPITSLCTATDRVIRSHSDITADSETALKYLAWLMVLNLRNARISLGQSLIILGFFEPLDDKASGAFTAKVLILAHVLRIAAHVRATSPAEDTIDVDGLADSFLVQTVLAVFPPAGQVPPVTKAQTDPRRELLRQCLQTFVSVAERGQEADTSVREVDGNLCDLLRERTTELWDALVV